MAFFFPLDAPSVYLAGIGRNICLVVWDGTSKVPAHIQTSIVVDVEKQYEKNTLSLGKCDIEGRLWLGQEPNKVIIVIKNIISKNTIFRNSNIKDEVE